MDKMPKDIMVKAEAIYDALGRGSDADAQVVARAILAERQRCAAIVRDNQTIVGGEPCEPFMDEILRAIEAGQ